MLVAPNRDRTAHAVSVLPPTAEHPDGFHRLIGGSVEFGETHREAIEREVQEELAAVIRDLRYLDVVENIFRMNGAVGHEVVFVYTGRLDPEPEPTGGTLTEADGSILPVVWRPFYDANEPLPLFPAAAARVVVEAGASGDGGNRPREHPRS